MALVFSFVCSFVKMARRSELVSNMCCSGILMWLKKKNLDICFKKEKKLQIFSTRY